MQGITLRQYFYSSAIAATRTINQALALAVDPPGAAPGFDDDGDVVAVEAGEGELVVLGVGMLVLTKT